MDNLELLKKLEEVFREVLDDEQLTLTNDLTSNDIPGWDSLSHFELVSEAENKFSITIMAKEIREINSVKDFVELVRLKQL